ncbi:hypothetical protein [Streptomyces sp. RPT161]|uniref:hypothetical protein n=1 Tax=Streptomyces sp. RPT161 TaxID=3015993 RepID=UPI0022B91093|nr:hypothetical protein [Streptomyces sp. RPT161]
MITLLLAAAQPVPAATNHSPNGVDIATAVGTVATAVVAVAALITTIVLSVQERKRAATELERTRADADARVQEERDRFETQRVEAAAKFQEERERYQADIARAEEQLANEQRRVEAQRVKEYRLRTLESVAEQYARWEANKGQPEASEAAGRLQVLLRLLPDGIAPILKNELSLVEEPLDRAFIDQLFLEKSGNIPKPFPSTGIYADLARCAQQIAGPSAS